MHLGAAQGAMGGANQGYTLHFSPVTTSVGTVKIASDIHTTPYGYSFNGGNLSNDLKVHDVSASSSSGLQMHDPYTSVIIPHGSMTEAEHRQHVLPALLLPQIWLSTTTPPASDAVFGKQLNLR